MSPINGASAAAHLASPTITFSHELTPATVTPANFTLQQGGQSLTVAASYDPPTRTVRLLAPLVPGAQYTGVVGTGVTALGVEGLAQPFQWSFGTRAVASSVVADAWVSSVGQTSLLTAPDGQRWIAHWRGDPGDQELVVSTCVTGCSEAAGWQSVVVDVIPGTGVQAVLARAPDGRLHVGYLDGGNNTLRYATCLAGCLSAGAWSKSVLPSPAGTSFTPSAEATLLADQTGRLHLAMTAFTPGLGTGWRYATCSATCTDPANWAFSPVLGANAATGVTLARGGDGALYIGWRVGERIHLAACFSNCTSGAWSSVNIAEALSLTRVQVVIGPGPRFYLFYVHGDLKVASCQELCATPQNWTIASTGVTARSSFGNLDAAVDESGRIHVALALADRMAYATCAAECTTPASWRTANYVTGEPHHRAQLNLGPGDQMLISTLAGGLRVHH